MLLTGDVRHTAFESVRVSTGHSQVEDTTKRRGKASPKVSMVSGAERKSTHPHLSLCNTDHRPAFQGVPMLGKNALQRSIDPIGMHNSQLTPP